MMKTQLVLRTFLLSVLLSSTSLVATADVLTTGEGEEIEGKLIGFQEGTFRFQAGQQVKLYPAAEVKTVALDPSEDSAASQTTLQNMAQTLATIQQQLQQLQFRVDQLAASQSAQLQNVQQRVFELNPLSRVVVEDQRGDFQRDRSFLVTGFLLNNSAVVIYQPLLRLDLVSPDGSVVYSDTYSTSMSAIGPSQRARFRISVPRPPQFDSYLVTPVLDHAPDPGPEAGTYPSLRLDRRD
jgi:hypothetical protein